VKHHSDVGESVDIIERVAIHDKHISDLAHLESP
jgi:hypothetical protein